MTTQTPATAEIEKWLQVRSWVRKKNAESCQSWLQIQCHLCQLQCGFFHMNS